MRSQGLLTAALMVLGVASVGVAAANESPLAEAGLDQEADLNTTVYLNAGGSLDPDGSIDRWEWEIEAPNGSTVAPDCETCRTTWFVPQQTGQYNVTIRVTDDDGVASEDTLFVQVEWRPPSESGSGDSGSPSLGTGGGGGGTGGGLSLGGSTGGGVGGNSLIRRDGTDLMIEAGTVDPGDTVEVAVSGGENMEIDGVDFQSEQTGAGEAPLTAFSSEMQETGVTVQDARGSLTDNSISGDYETTSEIGSRTYEQRMNSLEESMEDSVLSGRDPQAQSTGYEQSNEEIATSPGLGSVSSGSRDSSTSGYVSSSGSSLSSYTSSSGGIGSAGNSDLNVGIRSDTNLL